MNLDLALGKNLSVNFTVKIDFTINYLFAIHTVSSMDCKSCSLSALRGLQHINIFTLVST